MLPIISSLLTFSSSAVVGFDTSERTSSIWKSVNASNKYHPKNIIIITTSVLTIYFLNYIFLLLLSSSCLLLNLLSRVKLPNCLLEVLALLIFDSRAIAAVMCQIIMSTFNTAIIFCWSGGCLLTQ